MRRVLTIALMAALLTGCQRAGSDTLCHSLLRYPPEVQAQALAEIRAGQAPTLSRFADDYGELRARIRANCP